MKQWTITANRTLLSWMFFIIFFASCISDTAQGLTFLSPPSLVALNDQPELVLSPLISGYGPSIFAPLTLEVAYLNDNVTGKLFLVEVLSGKSPEDTVRRQLTTLQARGENPAALALTSLGTIAGFGYFARDFSNMSWVNLPVVELSTVMSAQLVLYRQLGIDILVVLRCDDPNLWYKYWSYAAKICVGIIISSICAASIGQAAYKLYSHLRYGPHNISVVIVFLTLAIISCATRFWWGALNPFYLNDFSYAFTTITATSWIPLDLTATFLITLHWFEVTTTNEKSPFLMKFRVPFLVAGALMWVLELVSASLRGTFREVIPVVIVSWTILSGFGITFVFYMWICGVKLMLMKGNIPPKIRRSVILLMVSGLFILCYCIFTLVVEYRESLALVDWYTCTSFICLSLGNFLQISAIPFPTKPIQQFTDPTNESTNETTAMFTSAPNKDRSQDRSFDL